MISNKARYAFRALLAIAQAPVGEALASAEIARAYAIPHKYLEQILLDLRKAGILESRRGKSGGYAMLRPADTVTFGEVLRLFEGPLAPLPCLSRQAYRSCEDCVDERSCVLRREFARAYDASRTVLDSRTIAAALEDGLNDGLERRSA
ncbi:Rrf2 family transcriptional regulator [Erythrobacter arachoides]|uniref:Rrf2 family transcriptional regulator n=1 Tax=Aurantiacibacter arachoides TaxID=1850444 RepID=A0A845A4M8_9SPHN|nr:Rrf2 family transcriptional regulator [Aurantiacibacter arachoides]MXO93877.1 Rrf2 family transcriptional regulator [Aurantiacibacter arachoides]GGD46025.1 Rrf2 family transcriptional regulator [Aurantiacibacter arachoides]